MSASPVIISRKEAIDKGLKHYYSGTPCQNGHISHRRVNNYKCMECDRINKISVYRANIEKCRSILRSAYAINAEKNREYARNRYKANRENILERKRQLHALSPGMASAKLRAWHAHNPEARKEYQRKWTENNPEKVKSSDKNKRAKRAGAVGRHTTADINRIRKLQKVKCAYCPANLKDGEHVDHIIALSKGGTNWPANLQLLCPKCNSRKGAKDPIRWAQENGRLL